MPVILGFDASFCRRYKSWYFSRSLRAREIFDLRRAAECVWRAGVKLLEIKLSSRLDESRRASVNWIITNLPFSPSEILIFLDGDTEEGGTSQDFNRRDWG